MEENKPHKITVVDSDGQELSLTLWWDSDIYDWLDAFRLILKFITFGDELIKEALPTEDDLLEQQELKEKEKEDGV